MDNKALAEQMGDIYLNVQSYLETKLGVMPTTEQVNIVFIECSKVLITEMISKQRQGVPHKEETRSEEKPTEKQIAYAEKLGCSFAETLTRRGLSKWIDEHKND